MFIHRFWCSDKEVVFVIYRINFPPTRRRKLKFEKKEILYVNFVDTTLYSFMLNLVQNITFKYHLIVVVRV